ncbi:Hypothetical protein SRAE_2000164500 [Strongyloides ratti]|uniref:Uncharacterized protein n=1 Tax=Strongyloides ratti TaxID=34506 RepID=A0A090LHI9_STRRB|nr:Hypothetical protein SRAE_2000164500 [Strongyloides ratti]CEF66980.1 Hypothetical protein SRAE_2000164500 [Strongyloides ratti]
MDIAKENIRNFLIRVRKWLRKKWEECADVTQMKFEWPIWTPVEVVEMVGIENYDSSSMKFQMPFFWKSHSVPATRSWGIVVCGIECFFGLFCLLLNIIHFGIFINTNSRYMYLQWMVFMLTLSEIGVFFAFKLLFIIALNEKNHKLLRVQMIFQYATSVVLLLNASFSITADYGGYNEEKLYGQKQPILIRILAILSLIFAVAQLYLRLMTVPIYNFMVTQRRFCKSLYNCRWRYRKRVYFTYCSIREDDLKNKKEQQMLLELKKSQTTTRRKKKVKKIGQIQRGIRKKQGGENNIQPNNALLVKVMEKDPSKIKLCIILDEKSLEAAKKPSTFILNEE